MPKWVGCQWHRGIEVFPYNIRFHALSLPTLGGWLSKIVFCAYHSGFVSSICCSQILISPANGKLCLSHFSVKISCQLLWVSPSLPEMKCLPHPWWFQFGACNLSDSTNISTEWTIPEGSESFNNADWYLVTAVLHWVYLWQQVP